ncbi:hypothetical protein MKW94_018085, partial [Papaver nudicaule]|nr:hypothetical protein [Papaver nudicaule]
VTLFYKDGHVDGKGVVKKFIDQVKETYYSELTVKPFAFDGNKSQFTVETRVHRSEASSK